MSESNFNDYRSHYTPDELATLGTAYETVCDAARLREASPMIRDLVASSVLDLASSGERDPRRVEFAASGEPPG